MPGNNSKGKGRSSTGKPLSSLTADDDYLLFSTTGDDYNTEPTATTSTGRGKKRTDTGDDIYNLGSGEMEKMLASFGADFSKSIQNKRKKLDTFTQASLQSSNKKMKEMTHKQQQERQKLTEGYHKQVDTILSQWEDDIQKMKEGEEKITTLLKQHHKLFQQQRVVQSQRFKTMKQLQEDFMKGLAVLEQNHEEQTNTMQDELKQEMTQLRKKILMESQQQEMSTVRRSLQLLAQVGEE